MVFALIVVDVKMHLLMVNNDADLTEHFAGDFSNAEQFLISMKNYGEVMKKKKGKIPEWLFDIICCVPVSLNITLGFLLSFWQTG